MLSNKNTSLKSSEYALNEKCSLISKRFYDLERTLEEKVKSYEETIYSMNQELKMRKREFDKMQDENEDLGMRAIKIERKEKNFLN